METHIIPGFPDYAFLKKSEHRALVYGLYKMCPVMRFSIDVGFLCYDSDLVLGVNEKGDGQQQKT